jgi:hypothetical protein
VQTIAHPKIRAFVGKILRLSTQNYYCYKQKKYKEASQFHQLAQEGMNVMQFIKNHRGFLWSLSEEDFIR